MPKKQPIAPPTVTSAPSARVAKPRTTRVKTATHSKSQAIESTLDEAVEETPAPAIAAATPVVDNPHDAIAKIAYGYWEARGYRPGNPQEDWVRAENEYLTRSTSK